MTEDEARARVIAAMCPARVCNVCGEPSRRISEISYEAIDKRLAHRGPPVGGRSEYGRGGQSTGKDNRLRSIPVTLGWTDCGHDDWRPGITLDPFAT